MIIIIIIHLRICEQNGVLDIQTAKPRELLEKTSLKTELAENLL